MCLMGRLIHLFKQGRSEVATQQNPFFVLYSPAVTLHFCIVKQSKRRRTTSSSPSLTTRSATFHEIIYGKPARCKRASRFFFAPTAWLAQLRKSPHLASHFREKGNASQISRVMTASNVPGILPAVYEIRIFLCPFLLLALRQHSFWPVNC